MDDVDNSYRELAGRCEWHEGIEVARTYAFEGPRLFSAQYGLAADPNGGSDSITASAPLDR